MSESDRLMNALADRTRTPRAPQFERFDNPKTKTMLERLLPSEIAVVVRPFTATWRDAWPYLPLEQIERTFGVCDGQYVPMESGDKVPRDHPMVSKYRNCFMDAVIAG